MANRLSRRHFLFVSSGVAMSVIGVACGQASPPAPTQAPAPATAAPAAAAPTATTAPAAAAAPAATPTTAAAPAAAVATATPAPAAAAKPAAKVSFTGQTITVGGPTGPAVTSPFEKYRGVWMDRTGAKVELITFPFADLYDKIRTTIAAGKPFADMYVFSAAWGADIMGTGTLLEVPKEIQTALHWDDLALNFSKHLLLWAGKVFDLPYDGDSHIYYYRNDLLNDPKHKDAFKKAYGYDLAPATTWDMYRDVAEYFTKTDWNAGGEHYGTIEAMGRKKWSWYTFFDRAAALGKHPSDPSFFFDPASMKPRINSPPFVRALEEWKKMIPFGPSGMVTMGYDEDRIFYPGGKAAQTYEWHDIGTLSYDAKRSTIKGNMGCTICPGSKDVYNPQTKAWEKGTGAGGINFAPYQCFGGWTMGAVKGTKIPDAVFDFSVYMGWERSMDENVLPDSGVNPSRTSHFTNLKAWADAGLDERSAKEYLTAIKTSYEHPNSFGDPRIPAVFEYYDIVEEHINSALVGQEQPQQALDSAAKLWEDLTDRVGRDKVAKIYHDDLGI